MKIKETDQTPIGICNRTKSLVYPSFVEGYTAYCPELDEDLYQFEFTPFKDYKYLTIAKQKEV